MQSVSHLGPRTHRRRVPWEGPRAPADRPFGSQGSRVEKSSLAFPLESPTASDPPRLSCEFKVGDGNGGGEPKPLLLPVVVQRSGRSSRCAWDGTTLALVDFEREPPEGLELVDGGLARLVQTSTLAIRGLFVPRHVQENYMGYLRWKFLHRLFSSSLQVLATQVPPPPIHVRDRSLLPPSRIVRTQMPPQRSVIRVGNETGSEEDERPFSDGKSSRFWLLGS